MDFTETNFDQLTTRKSSDILTIVCDGCGEDFSLPISEIRRRLGKRQRIDMFCTIKCRREHEKYVPPLLVRERDSYNRIRVSTWKDDDTQNVYYNIDD